MRQIEGVVFDIDGTVAPDVSWTALTRDLGASVDIHKRIFTDFLDKSISYEQSKEQLLELWKNTGNAKRSKFIEIFESWTIFP